jgi:hypothetical protein
MSVTTVAERNTYSLDATGPDYQQARVRVAPYVDLRDAGDVVLEVLVHDAVNAYGNTYLIEGSVELRAVSCSPHDPETLFEGGVVATTSFVNSSAGSVLVSVPSGEWGDAVAVYVVLSTIVITPG